MGWTFEGSCLDYWQAKQFIVFLKVPWTALGPTLHLISWEPSAIFPCGNTLNEVDSLSPYILPTIKINGVVIPLPHTISWWE